MTYEELLAMAKDGDPLFDPDHPEKASITAEGLLILGSSGPEEYASDILIRIEPEGLRAWMRDPEGTSEEDRFHGPDWTAEAFFQEYESLCSWAYGW